VSLPLVLSRVQARRVFSLADGFRQRLPTRRPGSARLIVIVTVAGSESE
jgi:hypothetical protein